MAAAGPPRSGCAARKGDDGVSRSAAGRRLREALVGDRGRVRGGVHDVSTLTAAVGRTCGDSPRRKRSIMSRRPPQQGQAGVDVSSLVTGSGSEQIGDGGASRLRIWAMLAARVPLANRP